MSVRSSYRAGRFRFPGEIAWFSASVEGANPEALEFGWTSSAGKVAKHDGKLKIGIPFSEDLVGISITVTVKVKGFPEGCPSAASETMSICIFADCGSSRRVLAFQPSD